MIDIDEQLESSTPMHPSRAARLPSSHDRRPPGATSRSRRRTVAITGAAGGLGKAFAFALRSKKANLALIDLDAQATADQAERLAGKRVAVGLEANVLDLASLEPALASAEQHFGRVDVVIAAAGIALGSSRPMEIIDPDDWDRTIAVNVSGVWRTMRAGLPYVRRQQGSLVAISSTAAFVHNPLTGPYPASKAAVWATCNGLRLDLRHQGVHVASTHPTFFKTPMTEEALDDKTFIHFTGNAGGLREFVDIDVVVTDIVRGIERRQAHIITPRRLRPPAIAPGIFGPLIAKLGFPGEVIEEATAIATREHAAEQQRA